MRPPTTVITRGPRPRQAVDARLARGAPTLDAELLARLRGCHDKAASGITHNWHRDWRDDNHPQVRPGYWLHGYKYQAWLLTCEVAIDWTYNFSEFSEQAPAQNMHYARCRNTSARSRQAPIPADRAPPS